MQQEQLRSPPRCVTLFLGVAKAPVHQLTEWGRRMSLHARWLVVGTTGIVLGLGLLQLDSRSALAQDKEVPKELRDGIQKIADTLGKDKSANVAKDAQALKEFNLKVVMRLFKLRKNGGFGFGDKPAAKQDGMEAKLDALSEDELNAADLAAQADAIKQMGNRVAALAALTEARPAPKTAKKKDPKNWVAYSQDMKNAGLALAAAAGDKKPADIKKAAERAGLTCTKCHDDFREED